jgi:hypothetical protein
MTLFAFKNQRVKYSRFASVALVVQNSKRMRHIVSLSVASLTVPNLDTLSHKRHDLRKKELLNLKCVFGFSLKLFFVIFLI